ncbi:photosystem II biogenesis protein Psp29 [Crocosphaera sp. XPORK-15E]|uniref:photosystem II biogenesis protein Psp29 n=1 Tax=Crocosphaera sp. XPORK-15E TaxID=3110247 RepID=UPI002B200E3F|nr:photosystem II biogenesis protein Psp29 [Crocosphaera sp. XPORK-15E]MEA5534629.1 photosystem II biogenesis protein Psp29 [Crocosphaera sp. XPORK-15E]
MNNIRTVSDTKREFYHYHIRPINSVYRRFVEELLVEMHLLSVNVNFRYDAIYALGVVTSFERFIQGYQPETDKGSIFNAICQAVGGNSEQYRHDAQTLLNQGKEMSVEDFTNQMEGAARGESGDGSIFGTLQAIAQNPQFKYSRLFAVGLYTLLIGIDSDLVKNEENRNQILDQVSEAFNLSSEKFQKDLDLYRSNLDKMQQLLTVIEETLEADRKKRESASSEKLKEISDNKESAS